ncbi:MAG: LysM peptidoglycan-binding domain-containing protein [Terriglobia bacterium]
MKATQTLRFFLVGLLFLGTGQAQTRKQPAQGNPPRSLSQQQPGNHWSANPAAPGAEGYEVHTVKAGDTLWEVSKQYLKDPFLWPQIWEMNSQLKNPHWIYPGDQILIKKMVVMTQAPVEKTPEPVQQPEAPAPRPPAPASLAQAAQPAPAPVAPVAPPQPPPVATYSDLYCAGFFSAEPVQQKAVLVGGEESEAKALFSDRDVVYLNQGTAAGIKAGDELQVVRLVRDFAKWGTQFAPAKSTTKYGYYYQDVGRLRVLLAQEQAATAEIIFACEEMQVGDLLGAGETRVSPLQRPEISFDKFAAPNNNTSGRIFMTKEFRTLLGSGHVVYLDAGSKQNVQVGDYFRIIRRFNKSTISLFNRSDYAKNKKTFDSVRKVIGQAVVLRADPNVSTVMITHSTEAVAVGDGVEKE